MTGMKIDPFGKYQVTLESHRSYRSESTFGSQGYSEDSGLCNGVHRSNSMFSRCFFSNFTHLRMCVKDSWFFTYILSQKWMNCHKKNI